MTVYKGVAVAEYLDDARNGIRAAVGIDSSILSMMMASPSDRAIWEMDEADNVTIYWDLDVVGTVLEGAVKPNTVYVSLYEGDSGTVIASTSFTPTSQTTDGTVVLSLLDGAGKRYIGDMRLYIRLQRTDIVAYDVNSDNNHKGVIRVNPLAASVTTSVTNSAGAVTPAAFGDILTYQINLGNTRPRLDSSIARRFTATVQRTDVDSGRVAGTTESVTDSVGSVLEGADNSFAAALHNYKIRFTPQRAWLTPASDPNVTWIRDTYESAAFDVDPRLTVDHHLQVNASVLDPAADRTPKTRLTSDLGFVGFRLTNVRGEGENGVVADETLVDAAGLVPAVISRSVTTTTVAAQDGWSPTLASWDSALPGGNWIHTVELTGVAAGLEIGKVENYALLAINPNFQLVVGAGHPQAADQPRHWHIGDTLLIGVALFDTTQRRLRTADADPVPGVVIGRFYTALGQAQYLTDTYTWVHLSSAAEAYRHPLSQSAGDPNVWVTQLPNSVTSGFSNATLFFVATLRVDGTPYSGTASLDVVGVSNDHHKYEIDPIAFALHGVLGNR